MYILSVVGTRPQAIKLNMIVKNLPLYPEITHKYCWTGQHYDDNMSKLFFDTLQLPNPDVHLGIGRNSMSGLPNQASHHGHYKTMTDIIQTEKPDVVMVYGDCNSTWLAAESAYMLSVPVAHVESGCRSGENTLEEKNRILTDRISEYNFAPTITCYNNLECERVPAYLVGDVMYDSYLYYQERISNIVPVIDAQILLTIHRPDNDYPEYIESVFSDLAHDGRKVFFPAHPRIEKTMKDCSIEVPENIEITAPIDYFGTQVLLRIVEEVWTDSGGLEREAYFAGKKTNSLRIVSEWTNDIEHKNSFGDGKAARKILSILSAKEDLQNSKKGLYQGIQKRNYDSTGNITVSAKQTLEEAIWRKRMEKEFLP